MTVIINTGMRTDIPAFYSEWFMNRIRASFVPVRNPYRPEWITRCELDPDVVDCIAFCTKDPGSMLKYLDELKAYHQYRFVTITPYGSDIEPNVPPKERVMRDFITLSKAVGTECVGWRYDPIFIDSTYTLERHISDLEIRSDDVFRLRSNLRLYRTKIVRILRSQIFRQIVQK